MGAHCIFYSPSGLDPLGQLWQVATQSLVPLQLTCHSFCGDIEVSAVRSLGSPRATALGHGGCLFLQGALL
jgi:hypothetical protein